MRAARVFFFATSASLLLSSLRVSLRGRPVKCPKRCSHGCVYVAKGRFGGQKRSKVEEEETAGPMIVMRYVISANSSAFSSLLHSLL